MAGTKFASWTHGCSAVCEANTTRVKYYGYGAEFRPPIGSANYTDYIHIPIPTPVVIQDNHVRMWRAYWLFDASGGAVLNATRVYDGFDRIRNFEPISVSGDHARGIDPVSVPEYKRNWIEWNPEAMYPTKPSWGISITLYVEFERADTSRLLVTAAGVDLKVG